MTAPLLEARDLGKRYLIRPERSLALGFLKRNRPREHWALRDLSMDVLPGEIVAVIGRNGAGKSTLLKLSAGVTRPTTGTLRKPQRIAPLIEVGAGFHPELSGRENVEVNARLLGIGPKEIRKSFDDIVAFAELAHAIDQPVRQYSSGMFMRLGFSVAVHTRPELLIVDEVLAVGDLPFQVRCLDRIREMREEGVGVLFVSHNLTAVLSLADRALLIDKGRLKAEGGVTDVVGAYHRAMAEVDLEQVGEAGLEAPALEIEQVTVVDETGSEPMLWRPGQRATVTVRVRATQDTPEAVVGWRFVKDGAGMVGRYVAADGPFVPPLAAGESADLVLDATLSFAGGGYLLDVAVGPPDYKSFLLEANAVVRFGIGDRPGGQGIVDVDPSFEVR
jgi:ABC-type polysaccharide/polyol phosphate transport system ATPase subunit